MKHEAIDFALKDGRWTSMKTVYLSMLLADSVSAPSYTGLTQFGSPSAKGDSELRGVNLSYVEELEACSAMRLDEKGQRESDCTQSSGQSGLSVHSRAAVGAAKVAEVQIAFDTNFRQSLWQYRETEAAAVPHELSCDADLLFAGSSALAMMAVGELGANDPEAIGFAASCAELKHSVPGAFLRASVAADTTQGIGVGDLRR